MTQLVEHTRTVTGELFGCAAISPDHRFDVRELGEITMLSMVHAADAFRVLLG